MTGALLFCKLVAELEVELTRQLYNAGSNVAVTGEAAEEAGIDIGAASPGAKGRLRIVKVGVIEGIESFQSQLEPHLFPDWNVLHEGQVAEIQPWPMEAVSTRIPKRAKCCVANIGWIEEEEPPVRRASTIVKRLADARILCL